jgi:hypothetical protein
MFATKIRRSGIKQRRSKGFTFLTGVLSVALLIGGSFEFIPAWILGNPSDIIHLWHIAELGALSAIFLGGIVLSLLRQPEEKPLLAQFFVLSGIILALSVAPFEMKAVAVLLVAGLFALVYPNRNGLLSFAREGSISIALLVLSLLFAVFLMPVVWRETQYQIVGMTENDVHALLLHWIGSATLIVLLLLAGLLSSTKQPGWKELAIITGAAYCYLGVIAMIVPGDAGSWGETGGLFSIIGGVLYMLFTLAEAQSTSKVVSKPEPETSGEARPIVKTVSAPAAKPAFTSGVLAVRNTGKLVETLSAR